MEDLFEIKVIDSQPIIKLLREIDRGDLAPVSERENTIRFILDDEWEEHEGSFTLKLRLRYAVELDKKLRELSDKGDVKMSAKLFSDLSGICCVQRTSVNTEEEKEDKEEQLYKDSLIRIGQWVDEFNITSMMEGVTV